MLRKSFSDIGTNGFYYNQSDGILAFNVGEESDSVTISSKDLFNNDFPDAQISYLISDITEISKPLFYPNPFILGSGELKLGFSITQPSTVTIHIFNFQGISVFIKEQFSNTGFNNFTFNTESFIAPGFLFVQNNFRRY